MITDSLAIDPLLQVKLQPGPHSIKCIFILGLEWLGSAFFGVDPNGLLQLDLFSTAFLVDEDELAAVGSAAQVSSIHHWPNGPAFDWPLAQPAMEVHGHTDHGRSIVQCDQVRPLFGKLA
jgi:hypothetical protein